MSIEFNADLRTYKDAEMRLKEILLYRKIVRFAILKDEKAWIRLDNGTELFLEGNDGCTCGNGCYPLTQFAEHVPENVITNVKVCISETDCDENETKDVFSLFVFFEDEALNLVTYEGFDNGYYGQGFWVHVTFPGGILKDHPETDMARNADSARKRGARSHFTGKGVARNLPQG